MSITLGCLVVIALLASALFVVAREAASPRPLLLSEVVAERGAPAFMALDYSVQPYSGAPGRTDRLEICFIGVRLAKADGGTIMPGECRYIFFCDNISLRAIASEFVTEDVPSGYHRRPAAFYPRVKIAVFEVLDPATVRYRETVTKPFVLFLAD
ncbi:MAG: hypothetical protein R3B57_09975 [Phycisphaerales bacterium]